MAPPYHQFAGSHTGIPQKNNLVFRSQQMQKILRFNGISNLAGRVQIDMLVDTVMEKEEAQVFKVTGPVHGRKKLTADLQVRHHRPAGIHD